MNKLWGGRGAACTILTVAVLLGTAVAPAHAVTAPSGAGSVAAATTAPAYAVKGAIRVFYDAAGGAGGYLGSATEAERNINGGWKQSFTGGTVYVTPPSGATFAVTGAIGSEYTRQGAQAGSLGWPVAGETSITGGSFQAFQRGRIYSHPTFGAVAVQGGILGRYLQEGGEGGPFGWPTGGEALVKGGWSQQFQNGVGVLATERLFLSSPEMYHAYLAAGGAAGRLGLPTGHEQPYGMGSWQSFAGGTLHLRNGLAFVTAGAIGRYFDAQGGLGGALGWPVGPEVTRAGGWTQEFENGTVHASGAGIASVTAPVLASFLASGGTGGPLGWARGEATSTAGTVVQQFSGGHLVVPASGTATAVQGTIGQAYARSGGPTGALGLPLGPENKDARGWQQDFDGGSILASGYGTWAVPAPLDAAYQTRGGRGGVLGYPSGPAAIDGPWGAQSFSGGSLYLWDDGTELVVKGAIGSHYQRNGGDAWIGWPVSDEVQIPGGWVQDFEAGTIYAGSRGVIAVKGAIFHYYASLGYENHRLGWPVSAERPVAGGWRQDFQGGSIFLSNLGIYWVAGAILQYYDRSGGPAGVLGWPTSFEESRDGGWVTRFDHGWILASRYGTFSVKGAILGHYTAVGATGSELGWPIGDEVYQSWSPFPSWQQAFASGQIRASSNGTSHILGPLPPDFYAPLPKPPWPGGGRPPSWW